MKNCFVFGLQMSVGLRTNLPSQEIRYAITLQLYFSIFLFLNSLNIKVDFSNRAKRIFINLFLQMPIELRATQSVERFHRKKFALKFWDFFIFKQFEHKIRLFQKRALWIFSFLVLESP